MGCYCLDNPRPRPAVRQIVTHTVYQHKLSSWDGFGRILPPLHWRKRIAGSMNHKGRYLH